MPAGRARRAVTRRRRRTCSTCKLVFVTGKGGVGKTTVAAALAQLAAEHGKRVLVCEVDAKGDLAVALRGGAHRLHAPGDRARASGRMSMDTEASLREYLKLHLRIPVVGRIGPLAKAFDFVATAAPGVREILTVGKLCYEVGAPLRPGRGRRPGQRPHHRPAGRAPGHQRPGQGRADPHPDRLDARHPLRPAPDRAGGGDHARGDAGDRDARAGRRGWARRPRCASRPWWSTGSCPSCSASARRRSSSSCAQPETEALLSERAGGAGRRRCSRRPGWPSPCAAPGSAHLQRLRPGLPQDVPVLLLPYLFARSYGAADHPPGGGIAWARSSGCDGAATATGRRRANDGSPGRARCCAPRRSSSPAGPGGVGKTTTAAALAAMAACRAGRPGPGAHGRPGPAPGRRPRPARASATTRSASPTRSSRRPAASPGASCGRPCSTPSRAGTTWSAATPPTPRPASRSWPTRSTRTSRAASSSATTTSPWSASTRSTPRATTT